MRYFLTGKTLITGVKRLPRLFHLLFMAIFSGCVTYHFADHENYRNFFPVKDKHEVSSADLDLHKFNNTLFSHPDTNGTIQYVLSKDVRSLLQTTDSNLLVILYFPNCSSAEGKLEIAEFAQQNGLPYLLISDTYSPARMQDLYYRHHLKNRNLYILPTLAGGDNILFNKRLSFIRELSPELYTTYRDELIFVTALIVSKSRPAQLYPFDKYGFQTPESIIGWLKEQYRIVSR